MPDTGDADVVEIQRLIKLQTDAYNAGDAVGFLATISEDRVSMNPDQPVMVGRGDPEELSDFFSRVEQRVELEIEEVVAFGDWAFERGQGHGTLAPKSTQGKDPAAEYSYKYIRIWRRQEDGWKVARSIWNRNDSQPIV